MKPTIKFEDFKGYEDFFKYMNKKRHIVTFLFVLYIVIGSIVGVSGFGLFVAGPILTEYSEVLGWSLFATGFICFLVLCPIFVTSSIKVYRSFLITFLNIMTPFIAKDYYEDFIFKNKIQNIDKKLEKNYKFALSKKPSDDMASFCSGKVFGLTFISFFYECQGFDFKHKGIISESKNNYKKKKAVPSVIDLSGRYILVQFKNKFESELIIKNKDSFNLFKKFNLKTRIESESITFNNKYDVLCSDNKLNALRVLTPQVIDGINRINTLYGGYINVWFKENNAHIYFDRYNSGFKLGLSKKVTMNTIESFKDEVKIPYEVFKALNFNSEYIL